MRHGLYSRATAPSLVTSTRLIEDAGRRSLGQAGNETRAGAHKRGSLFHAIAQAGARVVRTDGKVMVTSITGGDMRNRVDPVLARRFMAAVVQAREAP